jgi:serine/threonine-protein kinase
MITREGVLKLTDFGIAKDTDVTALTGQNSTIGTAAYMSPEQCKGDRNLTAKSDLYSLGIVFYELLTGKKPFYADTTVDMFLKHVNEPAPRPGKLVPDLPGKFEALILQLMEKDKDDRPVDAAWVIRMLTEIEEDAAARKSAGLLAVTNRRGEKTRNFDGSKLDDDDKDAARALRGKKKKAKKHIAVPLLQQKWLKAAAILLVLLGMGFAVYFAFRPASADKLAKAIDDASTPDARLEAATRYLEKYGEKSGPLTDKAATVFREITTRKREEVLAKRFVNKMQKPDDADDKEAFDTAWQAMEAERAGSLKLAAEFWNKTKSRFPDEAKLAYALKDEVLAKARWGWVADKRLADLRKVDQLAATLRQKIENNRKYEIAFSAEGTNPESLAIRALRLEEFGDKDKAARVWDQLITLTEKDPDKREWFLLACQQRAPISKPADDATKQRVARITQQLAEAQKLVGEAKANPDNSALRVRVRTLRREVTDLYDDETDGEIKPLLTRAKAIADSVSK